jgi:sugar phosphate isomerase/epimerase
MIGVPLRPVGAAGPCPDAALEILAEAAELAGNLGLQLGLENEPGTWAETGAEAAAIVRTVGHHALRLCWDPAVSLMAGEAPYDGLQAVQPYLLCMRVRDVGQVGGRYAGVLPGDGLCSVRDLVTALAEERFGGTLSLDPRLTPRLEGARAAFEAVERMRQTALRAAR